jgi:hypothetical protein
MEAELIRDWGLLPQREFENCWEFPPLIDARKVGWAATTHGKEWRNGCCRSEHRKVMFGGLRALFNSRCMVHS